MNINTRDLGFLNFNGTEMQWLKYNNLLVWEAWKKILASGILPLTPTKSKGADLVDYKIYGESVQEIDTSNIWDGAYTTGNYYDETGNLIYNDTIAMTNLMEVKFKYYDVTAVINSYLPFNFRYNFFDENKNWLSQIVVKVSNPNPVKTEIEIPKKAKYINFSVLSEVINSGQKICASSKNTPTPEAPIEIESVGDKTKNLVDYTQSENGTLDSGSGQNLSEEKYPNRCRSPFTYLEAGNYVISFSELISTGSKIYTYSKADQTTYIKTIDLTRNGNISTFTLSSACYIRHTIQPIDTSSNLVLNTETLQQYNPMLEKGSTATEYEPYGYRIPVKVKGSNMFNKSKSPTYSNNGKVTVEETETGVKLINPAISSVGPFFTRVYAIDAIENIGAKTVYINVDVELNGVPRTVITLGYCDEKGGNRKAVKQLSITESGNYTNSLTIDTETYAGKYLGLWLYSIATSDTVTLEEGSYVEYSNVMLSIGESEYEPYVEPVTTNIYLDEPLRKINDYADYIDFESKTVVRVIDKFVLDGTESYSKSTAAENRFTTYTPKRYKVTSNSQKLLCDRLIYNGKLEVGTIAVSYSLGNDSGSQLVFGMEYNTLEEFKQYLVDEYTNGTPMKVFYILDTPDDPQPIDLPNIPTHKGTTIIEVDTTIQPSNAEVVYMGKP